MGTPQRNRKRFGAARFLTRFMLVAASFLLSFSTASQAQSFSVLYSFTGDGSNGAPYQPYNGLSMTLGGTLYGTTWKGGAYENGTVFALKPAGDGWLLNVLYNFQGGTDGSTPVAGVTIGPSGVLYGTTAAGGDPSCGMAAGCGTVYSLRPPAHSTGSTNPPWTETVLYRFAGHNDGAVPKYGAVAFDTSGNMFGTTEYGGTGCGSPGCGTVYELSPSGGGWTERVLHSFDPSQDGSQPMGGIILDLNNDLYGVTSAGNETFFTLEPDGGNDWVYFDLQPFISSVGCDVDTSLLLDLNTFNFYGVAQGCGPSGAGAGGTVFNWFYAFNPVYNFDHNRGITTAPEGPLIEDAAGDLYGVSYSGGAQRHGFVYALALGRNGWIYTDLHDFTGGLDGAGPVGNLVMDASGALYGVTTAGGSQSGGVIFKITLN